MAERGPSQSNRRFALFPGGRLRKKFFLAFLTAGLVPLLFLVYLGLPVVFPTTVGAPLYPKGAPVFFVRHVMAIHLARRWQRTLRFDRLRSIP